MRRHLILLFRALALAAIILPAALQAESERASGGRIVYHYVGRVSLNFATGKAIVIGYFTHIDGIPAGVSLFRGTPGESTALFTFRADANFQALAGNGDLGNGMFALSPTLILPGEFNVYFDSGPNRNWNEPNSFTTGTMVASFQRELEQMAIFAPVAANAATATLKSSRDFTFDNRLQNFRSIARAVTNVSMGGLTPLPGSTPAAPAFAFAGYALSAGR